MNINEITVKDMDQFLQSIKDIISKWCLPTAVSPWFRGQGNSNDHLKPGIFRKAIKEQDISNTFKIRAGMYIKGVRPTSNAQWLSFMQHVGIPTRLLDWTESPLIALFFAVNSLNQCTNCNNTNNDGGVWMLHPLKLNNLSNIDLFPASDIQPVYFSYQQAFQDAPVNGIARFPIAVYSTHVHPRMAAQRSVFTIHGSDEYSFENQLKKTSMPSNNYFVKFVISRNLKAHLNKDLSLLGIRYNTLFPDIEGLVYELKKAFC
jgi:hypothetical protein